MATVYESAYALHPPPEASRSVLGRPACRAKHGVKLHGFWEIGAPEAVPENPWRNRPARPARGSARTASLTWSPSIASNSETPLGGHSWWIPSG